MHIVVHKLLQRRTNPYLVEGIIYTILNNYKLAALSYRNEESERRA